MSRRHWSRCKLGSKSYTVGPSRTKLKVLNQSHVLGHACWVLPSYNTARKDADPPSTEPVADLKASNRVIGVGGHEMKPRAAALLADEDVDDGSTKRRSSTFLNVVVLGNVVSALRHSLQDRLSKGSGRSRADEINLKLRTSTGLRIYFPSVVILIRTMHKKGPRNAADIPWVALIGQSVSIASAQSGGVGSESSLETAWRAETESLKTILIGAPQNKLGRVALVDTLAKQIRARIKLRLPNILSG
ncbi:hypothetical protein B296_00011465 [Ensete ventricosum]|uniref:Uncharacterized protein n=1 Tax=Ensete ventricosum TaxID=4639 RepID=A0A427B7D2_ENSVE|nr:hypothetical protein B296_00011465 [Ensete ventricosum]